MLRIESIDHRYDGEPVLSGVSLDVAEGEIVCLLGASGSGKTTLLRIVAGLEQPDGGDVSLDGRSILGVPVHARGFGLMFQDFALFPHMTVAGNVAFGLRMQGWPRTERDLRVEEALRLIGLEGFGERDVSQLSGGEKQRVALARSLAPRPRLLMLDEPLGSLDVSLRERLMIDLQRIIKSAGLTALYVTHDHGEAFAIADRIAVLHQGRLMQVADPQRLYRRPATAYVARFLGLNNIVPVDGIEAGRALTALGAFEVEGRPSALLLHPDGLRLAEQGIPVVVRERLFRGGDTRLMVRHASGTDLTLSLPSAQPVPAVGASMTLACDPAWIVPLNA